jgi:pimeloyl-ACP methyl ester carboxylesterase
METFFFEHNKNVLAYCCWGRGSKIMLAFHGFGQNKEVFRNLAKVLENEYTFYSFDLFFHGESHRNRKNQPISKEEWQTLLTAFLEERNIEYFSLTGYSIGGKFVLATLEAFPDKVKELILIAPDGVKTSLWYSLATYPGWTQQLFKTLVFYPKHFQRFAGFLQSIRLVDKSLVKFAGSQLRTREQRLRVYYSWLIFKELHFEMRKIGEILNNRQIPLLMYLGKYDRMMRENNMQILLSKVKNHKLYILDCGHNTLIEHVAKNFKEK